MQALSGEGSRDLDDCLLDSVAASLQAAGLQELAGDLQAWRLRIDDALACYRAGHAHGKAVALAASHNPLALPAVHEAWAEWLMGQQQPTAAIEHYLAAGKQDLAFTAALGAQELDTAAAILEAQQVRTVCWSPKQFRDMQRLDAQCTRRCSLTVNCNLLFSLVSIQDAVAAEAGYAQLAARHESAGRLPEAQRAFCQAGKPEQAIGAWLRASRCDEAKIAAASLLGEGAAHGFFNKHAKEAEGRASWQEAEAAWVSAGQIDTAVLMHRQNRDFDAMLRVVSQQRPVRLSTLPSHLDVMVLICLGLAANQVPGVSPDVG